jgi:hypothetical protein
MKTYPTYQLAAMHINPVLFGHEKIFSQRRALIEKSENIGVRFWAFIRASNQCCSLLGPPFAPKPDRVYFQRRIVRLIAISIFFHICQTTRGGFALVLGNAFD